MALVIGIALASGPKILQRLDSSSEFSDEPGQQSQHVKQGSNRSMPTTSGQASKASNDSSGAAEADIDSSDDANIVVMNDSTSFERFTLDGIFQGYRVIGGGSDPRFSDGDIIVEIGGMPVEDSAAGGELLMIAMQNPNTPVKLLGSP